MRLVLASGVVAAVLATLVAMFVVTPSYAVTMKLYVSARGSTANDRLQNSEYARTHVSSYTELITSSDLLDAVRTRLGIRPGQGDGYADLAKRITASNIVDTAVITVTVQDESPREALQVATAIGEVSDAAVARVEGVSTEQSPVRVSVLAPPALPTSPESPSRRLFAGGGLVLGLAVGLGLAWVAETGVLTARRRSARGEQGASDSWSWGLDPSQQPDQDPPTDPHEVVRPIRGDAARHAPRTLDRSGHADATKRRRAAR